MFDCCPEAAKHPEHSSNALVASTAEFRPRAVRRAIEYMHANLADSVRLEDLAGTAGLSVFHFSRLFRDTTGMAPHRYLTEARVEKVKWLLLENQQGLATIAEETGFADQSHMSKVFRRFTGTTPKQFRDSRGTLTGIPGCINREGNGHAAAK